MIVYFAPWCGNWRNEAPFVAKLYQKYKDQGFLVIGVSEYASLDRLANFWASPVRLIRWSSNRSRATTNQNAALRISPITGDVRSWGSPWNIFLEPAKLNRKGDVLTEKAWVVNGELIEDEVDKFIASKVAPANGTSAAVIEPCKDCQ